MTHRGIVSVFAIALAALSALLSAGCQGGRATNTSNADAAQAGQLAADATPIDSPSATLFVKGMSCPLCATNIDRSLLRVEGVHSVDVDMSTGQVKVDFVGKTRPTRAQLARAVANSGAGQLTEIRTP